MLSSQVENGAQSPLVAHTPRILANSANCATPGHWSEGSSQSLQFAVTGRPTASCSTSIASVAVTSPDSFTSQTQSAHSSSSTDVRSTKSASAVVGAVPVDRGWPQSPVAAIDGAEASSTAATSNGTREVERRERLAMALPPSGARTPVSPPPHALSGPASPPFQWHSMRCADPYPRCAAEKLTNGCRCAPYRAGSSPPARSVVNRAA